MHTVNGDRPGKYLPEREPSLTQIEIENMNHKGKPAACHPDRTNFSKGRCWPCYSKEYYARPEVIAHRTNQYWQKFYGITKAQYDAMFIAQDGRCAICLKVSDKRLSVDHDHKTGKVRKLLCNSCNMILGRLGESVETLQRMLDYIKTHEC